MAGKIFKLLSITAGGILALGGGAVGMHFAEPTLEKNFYPERLQKEEQLKKAFRERSNEVDLKKKKITSLEQQILKKEQELIINTELHKDQQKQIEELGTKLSTKKSELQTLEEEKAVVDANWEEINRRISLNREDILEKNGLDLDLLKVNIKEIEFKSFSSGWASFEAIGKSGNKVIFKVKKDNLVNYEDKVKEIRDKGICFELSKDFDQWNGKILVYTYKLGYEETTTLLDKKWSYFYDQKKEEIDLKDFFKKEHWKDAFRVYIAISKIESSPIVHDLTGSVDKLFHFDSGSNISQDFSDDQILNWDAFTDSTKTLQIWTSRFETKDDFVKYWITKTIDFIKTRRVDLSDLLNPIYQSKNYKAT